MDQIHKRFTAEQVKVMLRGYCQGILVRPAIEETLGISKSTFFVLLRGYRHNPNEFSLTYQRTTPTRLPASAEAKGKVERPYRWLQDRIVRTCAIDKLTTIEDVRAVLKEELDRYNNHQVHSTTGEVPSIRFDQARKDGNSLFRSFALPKPYTSAKDVFCLREKRTVNGYRKISLFNHEIVVPHVPLREEVEVHLVEPEGQKPTGLPVDIYFLI